MSLLGLLELREEMSHRGGEEARSSVLITKALRIVGSEMRDEGDDCFANDGILRLPMLEDVVADHVVVGVHELFGEEERRVSSGRFRLVSEKSWTYHLSVVKQSFEDEQTSVDALGGWRPESTDGLVEHSSVDLVSLLLISTRPWRLDFEAGGDEKSGSFSEEELQEGEVIRRAECQHLSSKRVKRRERDQGRTRGSRSEDQIDWRRAGT